MHDFKSGLIGLHLVLDGFELDVASHSLIDILFQLILQGPYLILPGFYVYKTSSDQILFQLQGLFNGALEAAPSNVFKKCL